MKECSRRYCCLNCNCQVIICSHCDRGNRYCKQCSPKIALKVRQRANKRYQITYQGRLNHAARQKRYRERERLKKKVTYTGSNSISFRDLLNKKRKDVNINFKPDKKQKSKDIFCHCCGKSCSELSHGDYSSNLNLNRKRKVAGNERINVFLRQISVTLRR